jgi:hypothetical protein
VDAQRLTVSQTPTGYWVVRRGAVQLAGGLTRHAAESERSLLEGLRQRERRRRRAPLRSTRQVGAADPRGGRTAVSAFAPRSVR